MKLVFLLCTAALATAVHAEDDPTRCKALRAEMTRIESAQRMPQTGPEQDRLTAEKRRVSDEMNKLKCSRMG